LIGFWFDFSLHKLDVTRIVILTLFSVNISLHELDIVILM